MTAPQPVTFSKRYVVYAVGLLAGINVVNYMDRMVLAVLLPLIKADLGLSDTQLGLLTGFAFALFYAAFGIPIARWADRGVRRNLIALAMTVWSAMTALSGAAQSFVHLLLARIGVGVGEAGCIPPSHSIISDYVPVRRRSSALAVHTSGATIGSFVGLALGGWLGGVIGWRLTFLALGIPGLLLALVTRLTLREPPRGHADGVQTDAGPPPLGEVARYLLHRRSYLHVVIGFGVFCFAAFGLNQWLPSFYVRSFGLSTAAVGALYGVAYGLGSTVGTLVGGPLADLLARRDVRWALWMGILAYITALPLGLAVFFAPTVGVAIAFNFAFTMVSSLPNGPVFAMIQSVVAPRMRAVASSIAMFAASVIGIGGGPFSVGLLSDLLAPRAGDGSLRLALILATIVVVWPVVHYLLAARTLRTDIRAAQTETDVMDSRRSTEQSPRRGRSSARNDS